MNISTVANHLSAIPGVGTVIGVSTILMNLAKIVVDIVCDCFYQRKIKRTTRNSEDFWIVAQKLAKYRDNRKRHYLFLKIGALRAIPFVSCILLQPTPKPRRFVTLDPDLEQK